MHAEEVISSERRVSAGTSPGASVVESVTFFACHSCAPRRTSERGPAAPLRRQDGQIGVAPRGIELHPVLGFACLEV